VAGAAREFGDRRLGGRLGLSRGLRGQHRDHRLGTAVLGRPGGAWFEQDALDLAEELSRRAALALDNALLYRAQLATSRALQQSLLPAALPVIPGLDVGVAYEAAGEGLEAGGDFYDVFAVDERWWRFAVGDVSGNGPEAAAVTGLARHVLHLLARQDRPLAEAVAQLNQAILGPGRKGAVPHRAARRDHLRPAGGVRAALAAGHPLPYLLEPAGRVRTVGMFGPLLGVLDQVGYATDVVHLAPGEALVCVTDGVLERRNAGRTLGEDDIGPLLAGCAGLSAAAIAAALRRAVVEYAPQPPRDDMAVLVLRAVEASTG
jgi:serine phosphatase RsbU (regulator of sigma subunit)